LKREPAMYIQDIAPSLAHWFIDDYDFDKSMKMQRSYYERFRAMDDRFGLTHMRLGNGHLHDSYILSKGKSDNGYALWLDDVAVCDFAGALRDKKGLNIGGKMTFPLGITACGVNRLSLNKVNKRTGRLDPCRPGKQWQYLSEEIIRWDEDGVEIAFVLWGGRKRVPRTAMRRYSYVSALLLIACKRLYVDQRQDIAWHEYFGHEYDDYYGFFKHKRDSGVNLSDYSVCCELVDEFDTQR